jgi:trehalose 6-phosphate synthase/phosphatase
LIIVSNRLPVTVSKTDDGLEFTESVGGLATGLASFYRDYDSVWIGWCGMPADQLDDSERATVREHLDKAHGCIPVFIEERDLGDYYEGFANQTGWPQFHYLTQYPTNEHDYWSSYVRVNRAFADVVLDVAEPGDVIWVHDYHLMLLPEMIRQRMNEATIGFFLHIPFPSFETFRLLPWRLEIVSGLLGSDLVGFHTFDYAKHFLVSVRNLTGHEHNAGEIVAGRRVIKVDSFPMGIDYERYRRAPEEPAVRDEITAYRERLGDRKIVLSVDRLDYSKGIVRRIEAIESFFDLYPEYCERVQVVLVAVPSRTAVREYDALKRRVDESVGRVNGTHGTIGWTPIEYVYASLEFEELVALYHLADVCLVTPLRDGMNLIAKEYVAANDGRGVLVLSEMAGAAKELGEALIVNPNNRTEVANAIRGALEMPNGQRESRNDIMRERLKRYNVTTWASDFMDSLAAIKHKQREMAVRILGEDSRSRLLADYRDASRRAIFLDYDGTIVDFAGSPEAAAPDDGLVSLLEVLAKDPANDVIVVSGRDRESLQTWLGGSGVDIVAEHGAFTKSSGGEWEVAVQDAGEWKDAFLPMLELFADRTPGSFVEEKEASLVWHYRRADPELAAIRGRELKDAALNLSTHLDVAVTEDTKILELRNSLVNEGAAVMRWLDEDHDFVLAIGDDWTDEDLFAVMPEHAYSIKVGFEPSRAAWNLDSVGAVLELLHELSG